MFGKLFGKKEEKAEEVVNAEINTPVAQAEVVEANVAQPSEEATVSPEPPKKENPKEERPAPLTYKEMKSLHKARYEDIVQNPKFKNAYLLKNTKTGQMVEIRAASSFHACNIIGWKPNKVSVVQITEIKEPVTETSQTQEVKKSEVPETTAV